MARACLFDEDGQVEREKCKMQEREYSKEGTSEKARRDGMDNRAQVEKLATETQGRCTVVLLLCHGVTGISWD